MKWFGLIVIPVWFIVLFFYLIDYFKKQGTETTIIFVLAIITIFFSQLQLMLGGE